MTADYGEIVRLANLSNRNLQGEEWADYQRDIAKLGPQRINLAIFARAILAGRPYQVTSANPQTTACYRSLASYLGARAIAGGVRRRQEWVRHFPRDSTSRCHG
jgi:hypothetical protein